MKYRLWVAGTAAVLALCSVSAAVAAARLPAPVPAAAPAAVQDTEPPAPAETDVGERVYLVRDYNGELCVFQDGALIERTGIPVSTLPKSDRALAEVGITVTGEAALSELLADLGS